jgi:hypothetical protein
MAEEGRPIGARWRPIKLSGKQRKDADGVGGAELVLPWPPGLSPGALPPSGRRGAVHLRATRSTPSSIWCGWPCSTASPPATGSARAGDRHRGAARRPQGPPVAEKASLFRIVHLDAPVDRLGRPRPAAAAAGRSWRLDLHVGAAGYFRMQPYGPRSALHRLQWVDPHWRDRRAGRAPGAATGVAFAKRPWFPPKG